MSEAEEQSFVWRKNWNPIPCFPCEEEELEMVRLSVTDSLDKESSRGYQIVDCLEDPASHTKSCITHVEPAHRLSSHHMS